MKINTFFFPLVLNTFIFFFSGKIKLSNLQYLLLQVLWSSVWLQVVNLCYFLFHSLFLGTLRKYLFSLWRSFLTLFWSQFLTITNKILKHDSRENTVNIHYFSLFKFLWLLKRKYYFQIIYRFFTIYWNEVDCTAQISVNLT